MMICAAGDVAICRRVSVFGVTSDGVHNPVAKYDEPRIRERSRLILYAIVDARKPRFPRETSYRYVPLARQEARYRWTSAAKADIKAYNPFDLGI